MVEKVWGWGGEMERETFNTCSPYDFIKVERIIKMQINSHAALEITLRNTKIKTADFRSERN